MKAGLWVCVGLLLSGLATAAESIHVKLELVRLEDVIAKGYSDYGWTTLQVNEKPKSSRMPPSVGNEVLLFGTLPLLGENGEYPFALGRNRDARWYERLYIHINEDGKIGPEERFETKAVEEAPVDIHPSGIFTPVVSTFVMEIPFGRPVNIPPDYVCELQVRTLQEREGDLDVRFFAGCYRKGRANINGECYEVVLIDRTLNGRFNDFARNEGNKWMPGDDVVFVPEGTASPRVSHDYEPLNHLRVVGEQLFEVSVTPDGSEMTLTPSDLPCGRLVMATPVKRLDLVGGRGFFCIRRAESTVLPGGIYALNFVTYEKDMPDDKKWTLFGISSPESPKVEIRPGKKTKLPFGPPFTSRVTFTPGYYKGSVSLDVELCGKGLEKYSCSLSPSAVYTLRSGNITIRSRSGKHLATVEPNVQHSVDAIPPPYTWNGPVPKEGVVAVWDPGFSWKLKQEKTIITPKALKDGQQR